MNNKNLIITTAILLQQLCAFSQTQPSKDDIVKSIEKIKILHIEENDIWRHSKLSERGEMRFIKDKFTNKVRDECLVIVPMETGRHYTEWIIFMYKNIAGYWIYGKWFKNTQHTIDLIDVDNNGIK